MSENIELTVKPTIDTTAIENDLVNTRKISEEKVEKSLNYDVLSPEEKEAIDAFLAKINVFDANQILQYGVTAQTKISKFSDGVLESVRTKKTGEVGGLLTDLVVQIKDFDSGVPKDAGKLTKGVFGVFNSVKKQLSKLIAKYDKIENNIGKIEKQLEGHKLTMMKDIAIFDNMYEKNLEYFKELSLYIIAGEKKLEELKTVTLEEYRRKAEETKEQTDVQALNDLNNMIDRFEKKVHDLKITRIISIQMAPQIRLIQNNDSQLIEKIQSSLINTIPLWKNQIVIALGITNAKSALGAQKQVTDITNEMLKKNSEILKQGTIEIAKESERAIVDVETLQKTNSDIIETLDAVIQIHEEGRAKRQEAEVEIQKIENELKEKLLEIEIKANKQ